MKHDLYWSFEGAPFTRRDFSALPAMEALWQRLNEADAPIDKALLTEHGLRALPLVEWWVEPRHMRLFDMLRAGGSSRGYFLPFPGPSGRRQELEIHESPLDDDALSIIEERNLFEYAFTFVDDRLNSLILTWHTDLTVLCMRPHLLGRVIEEYRDTFTLDGNGPVALSFQDALRQAFSRFDEWCRVRPCDEVLRVKYFDPLAWQLIRAV